MHPLTLTLFFTPDKHPLHLHSSDSAALFSLKAVVSLEYVLNCADDLQSDKEEDEKEEQLDQEKSKHTKKKRKKRGKATK